MSAIGLYLDYLAGVATGVVIGYSAPRIVRHFRLANARIDRDIEYLRNMPATADSADRRESA